MRNGRAGKIQAQIVGLTKKLVFSHDILTIHLIEYLSHCFPLLVHSKKRISFHSGLLKDNLLQFISPVILPFSPFY